MHARPGRRLRAQTNGAYFRVIVGTDPESWAGVHRLHHRHADTPLDPHSPVQRRPITIVAGTWVLFAFAKRRLPANRPAGWRIWALRGVLGRLMLRQRRRRELREPKLRHPRAVDLSLTAASGTASPPNNDGVGLRTAARQSLGCTGEKVVSDLFGGLSTRRLPIGGRCIRRLLRDQPAEGGAQTVVRVHRSVGSSRSYGQGPDKRSDTDHGPQGPTNHRISRFLLARLSSASSRQHVMMRTRQQA